MSFDMSNARRMHLFTDPLATLTQQEKAAGYHFCPDWDGLVVGPDDPEAEACCCERSADN